MCLLSKAYYASNSTGDEKLACVEFCGDCRNLLPKSFINIISGKSNSVIYVQNAFVLGLEYYSGTWTRENWETYPTIQRLRNTKQDDHEGMIYNAFNDTWGWF